jgi:hypothetical protein
MLLDSGADATMVPDHVVAGLGLDTATSPQFEIIVGVRALTPIGSDRISRLRSHLTYTRA